MRRIFSQRKKRLLVQAAALAGLTAAPVWAATYTWDPDGNFANGITPASGTWDASSTQWQTASADSVWSNGNLASYSGGSGGDVAAETYAVTVGSSAFVATGISILNTGFLLTAPTPTTLSLSGSQPVISLAAGKSVSFGGNLTIQGATTAMELTGASTLSTYNVLSGATLTAAGAVRLNAGILNVSGNVITGTNIILLPSSSATNAVVNLSSGIMSSGSNTTNGDGLRYGSGGTVGSATFNLDGGTLSVIRVYENGSPTSTFNFNGGTLQARANASNMMTGLDNAFVRTGGARIDSNGFNVTIAQSLLAESASVSGGLLKVGSGTLGLTGLNTYTGPTTVGGGTLTVDLSVNSSGVINSASNLSLGTASGGLMTLNILGKNSGSSSQSLGDVSIAPNSFGTIVVNPNNATGTTLTLGNNFSRGINSGVLIDLSSSNTGTRAVNTGLTLSNGVLGYSIVRDSTAYGFATTVSGGFARYTGATTLATSSDSAATNFITTASVTHNNGGWSANSIEFQNTSNIVVALGGTLTLSSGAILFSRNGGTLTLNGGQLGADNSEVIVHEYNVVGAGMTMTVNSTVSSGTGSLVKTGISGGTLVLGAENTYSGNTVILGGTLQVGAGSTTGSINVNSNIIDNGAFVLSRSDDLAYSNLISGSGTVTRAGGGKSTFNSSNSYTGQTLITGGSTIQVNSLGNWSVGNTTPGELGSPVSASGGTIVIGSGTSGVGTLKYVGAGEATNRTMNVGNGPGGNSSPVATIDASGTGALTISSIGIAATGTGSVATLILAGSNTGTNTITAAINNQNLASRQLAKVSKSGSGTWVLTNDTSTFSYNTLNVADGSLVARGDVEGSVFKTASLTNGSATVTVPDTTGLTVGDFVYGADPNGDVRLTISTISGNDLTLSATVAAATGATSLEFVNTAAQTSVFGSSRSHLVLGSASAPASNASIQTDGAYTIARPILVGDFATSGTYSIGGRAAAVSTFSGLITANRDLTVTQAGGGTLNVTGGITGSTVLDHGTQTITFAGPGAINLSTNGISDGTGGGTTETAVVVSGGKTTLGVAGTYSGGTNVTGGTLAAGAALGSGSVFVGAGATLELNAASLIDDSAALNVASSGTVYLGFSETVGNLVLGGVTYAQGTYDDSTDPSFFAAGSPGSITVVPEPAGLGLLAIGGLALTRRRRRKEPAC